MKEIRVHDKIFELFISKEEIQDRINEIGESLNVKFKGKRPLFLSILNGSFMFTADMVRACDFESEISFIKYASYNGLNSSGEVKTIIGLDTDIKGRDIIILEDIVDTGNTMLNFFRTLSTLEPVSVTLVSLLTKPEVLQDKVKVDYVGFEIPNKFVVGYGLDYDDLARNLADIYQLKIE